MKTFRVLQPEDCQKLIDRIDKIEPEDGAVTAGHYVKSVKQNRQLTSAVVEARPLLKAIEEELWKSANFRVITYPKNIVRLMLNLHADGEHYGRHIDNTWVLNQGADAGRADLSFSLFLQDPEEYEGGELVVNTPTGDVNVKLKAGEIVIYDSGAYHEVLPVSKGVRYGCVGWVQSWIPDPKIRSVMTDFDISIAKLKASKNVERSELDEFYRIYNEMLRAHMR